EFDCPRCHQVNAHYTGWRLIFNPKFAEFCTLCGADLRTGERDLFGAAHAAFLVPLVYAMHALAGSGAFVLLLALFFMGRLSPEWLARIRFAPPIAGAAAGLALAEWSRRRGTLVSNRRAGG